MTIGFYHEFAVMRKRPRAGAHSCIYMPRHASALSGPSLNASRIWTCCQSPYPFSSHQHRHEDEYTLIPHQSTRVIMFDEPELKIKGAAARASEVCSRSDSWHATTYPVGMPPPPQRRQSHPPGRRQNYRQTYRPGYRQTYRPGYRQTYRPSHRQSHYQSYCPRYCQSHVAAYGAQVTLISDVCDLTNR